MRSSGTTGRADQAPTGSVTLTLPRGLVPQLKRLEEDFFALCVEVGQRALAALMEADRAVQCGPKGRPQRGRRAGRSGSVASAITLGGRRIVIRRLRARTRTGSEVALPSFTWAAARDPLDRRTVEAVAVGVSTRRYERSLEALPGALRQRAHSKSAVSRRFVACSTALLRHWLARPVGALELVAVLIDGIYFRQRCILIALGIDASGRKQVLGLHEGSTENTAVAKALLSDLIERGLDPERPLLFVIDGGKGLRRAIGELWGQRAVVQRCQVHKVRNVRAHLPDRLQRRVAGLLQQAYDTPDGALARAQLERVAAELERPHPGAAASLREGLEETLTLHRLGITGALARTLRSTNVIENLNGSIAAYVRNVKLWRDGAMVVRWVGAALHEATRGFRRIRGHADLPDLLAALTALDKKTSHAA